MYLKKKYIPFSRLPLKIIGLRPLNRLCLSHISFKRWRSVDSETKLHITFFLNYIHFCSLLSFMKCVYNMIIFKICALIAYSNQSGTVLLVIIFNQLLVTITSFCLLHYDITLLVSNQLFVTMKSYCLSKVSCLLLYEIILPLINQLLATMKSYCSLQIRCCLQCNLIARYNSTACYNEMLLSVTNQLLVTNKSHCLLQINCLLQCNLIVCYN